MKTKLVFALVAKVAAYLEVRRKFEMLLNADDYRYFSFQVWQEGVARYTEYRMAQLAAKRYKASKEFRSLKDYKPFKSVADKILENLTEELTTLQLEDYKRVAFYPLGAGEALLLDRLTPRWKERYFTDKFYVDKYFKTQPKAALPRKGELCYKSVRTPSLEASPKKLNLAEVCRQEPF